MLGKRLALIEGENTLDKIRTRGYQSYFEFYDAALPRRVGCKKL